jgi:hypothetical protein|tara:strand:+ start:447 stop:662 length:216 start_codon:yes stop_codon:yes gene_type:complete
MNRERYIQVEGNSGLVRDRTTGAILNANSTEIQKARLKKNKEKQQEQEIQELKKDVSEIKVLLTKLIERND